MKTHSMQAAGRRGALHGWRGIVLAVIAIIAGLLIIARIAAPIVVTNLLNKKLSELPDYTGRVADVDLGIWRGVVQVKGFKLETRKKPADGVVSIPSLTMVIARRALFHRKLGGRAVIVDAELVVFNDEAIQEEAMSQKEEKREETKERVETVEKVREWQAVLRKAFPMHISRFEMHNTRIRFVDRVMNPHPEVVMERVGIVVTGLTNHPELGNDLPARFRLDGAIKTGGHVVVEAQVDPIADQPRFRTSMKLDRLELVPLNDFARFYGKADVESGRFTVFAEATAEGGHYQGYVKPFFENLEFKAVPEEKNPVKRAVTKVANAVASALKSDEDKTASKIPIHGNFTDNEADIWTTIRTLLRNAFVEALREGFAGQKPSD